MDSKTRRHQCFPKQALIVSLVCFLSFLMAGASDITWLGNSADWFDTANWSSGTVPEINDVVWISALTLLPVVDTGEAFCRGLILAEDATVTVVNGGALYIIDPTGDLDGDGILDIDEVIPGMMDINNNGLPNFDDLDSDGDGISDECEHQYPEVFDLYVFHDPLADYDGDGFTDLEECLAGTDPTDPNDYPVHVPALYFAGMLAIAGMIIVLAFFMLPKKRHRARALICLFLAIAFVLLLGYWDTAIVFGANDIPPGILKAEQTSVDFDTGNTDPDIYHSIPEAVRETDLYGTVSVDGSSIRPWNGRSTYVNRSVTLQAVNGPVFLGGVQTTLTVILDGEGDVIVASSYLQADHPAPTYSVIPAGMGTILCYLGERLEMAAEPAMDWGFLEWTGDVSGTAPAVQFQPMAYGLTITAVFSPPGTDLCSAWESPPPLIPVKAGDILSLTVRIQNIGQQETDVSNWTDGLFLSRDTVYDPASDLELVAPTPRSGTLGSLGFYEVLFSPAIPDVAPGVYYILGVADEAGLVTEANKHNNIVAAAVIVLDANLAQ